MNKFDTFFRRETSNYIALFAAILFLSCNTLPILRLLTGGFVMAGFAFFWFVLITINDFKGQAKNLLRNLFYGIWLIILCCYFVLKIEPNLSNQLMTYGSVFFVLLIAGYYTFSDNETARKIIFYTQFTNLLITSIYSIVYIVLINRDAARILATTWRPNDLLISGVGGYGFVYAIVGLTPALIMFASDLVWKLKVICYALVVILMFTIYYASYAMAYILLIAFIMISIYITNFKRKISIFSRVLLISVPIIALGLVWILLSMPQVVPNLYIQTRLIEIKDVITGKQLNDSADIMIRTNLYIKSIKGILKYPFTGCVPFHMNEYGNLVGYDMQWLNLLARYGIILGFFPIVTIYHNVKLYMVLLEKTSRKYMLLFVIYFTILGFLNTNFVAIIMIVAFIIIPNIHYIKTFDDKLNKHS